MMIDRVVINKHWVDLDKDDVIGEGGEAVIFDYNGQALKIWREPNSSREQKLLDFFRGSFNLPGNVLAPNMPVYDGSGRIVGFSMVRLEPGYDPIAMLGNRAYCTQHGLTAKAVTTIALNARDTLAGVHAVRIIVGDLNGLNEVINPVKLIPVVWIDVDSWQWGKHPCMVGTEDFLSPDLYGVDLSTRPYFKEEHDWYSFAVLLFRSLLRIHPFKAGIHPTYKSLMVRALQGITVLDPDVQYPAIGLPPEMLSDDLLAVLLEYLKRQRRDSFPRQALEDFAEILVECPTCHLWYAGTRKNCPGCQAKNVVDMRLRQILAGCDYETLVATSGNIIFFKLIGETIYCLADENGTTVLYKKSVNGTPERKELFATRLGARFGLFGENLVICLNPVASQPELLVVDVSGVAPKPVLKTFTKALAGGKAIFSCSAKYLYRIVGPRIVRGNLFGTVGELLDREVAQALNGQTWFTVAPNPADQELLLGFHRIFGDFQWFLVRSTSETTFEQFAANLPSLTARESLIDLSVKFSEHAVLVLRKTRRAGIDYIHLDMVSSADGQVLQSLFGKVSDLVNYDNVHGKAFKAGVILHPTDNGVVYEKIGDKQPMILADSDQLVGSNDALHPYGSNVLAVTDNRVILIKPKQRR